MNKFLLFILFSTLTLIACQSSSIEYYTNGIIKKECVDIDSLIFCELYDSIGNKSESYFQLDSFYHGAHTSFYSNGNLKEVYEYEHGIKHGDAKIYRKSGLIKTKGKYYFGENYFKQIFTYDKYGKVEQNLTSFYPIIRFMDSIPSFGELEILLGLPLESNEYFLDSMNAELWIFKYLDDRVQTKVELDNQKFKEDYSINVTTNIDNSDSILLKGQIRIVSVENQEFIDSFSHMFYIEEEQ